MRFVSFLQQSGRLVRTVAEQISGGLAAEVSTDVRVISASSQICIM